MNETCREHYLCLPNIGRCPYCEIDRLRAELETTKRHMAEDTRDIGALEDEVTALRAELAKAQEEVAGYSADVARQFHRAEAAEAREILEVKNAKP